MRCGQVSERLSSLMDGELPANEARALKAHLESCAACAGEYVSLRDLRSRLRSWDESENRTAPSRSFRRRVVEAARRETVRPSTAPAPTFRLLRGIDRRGALLVLGSVAAAVLLVVAALIVAPAGDGTPTEGEDAVAVRESVPADVAGRIALARRLENEGRRDEARGLYLRVLAVEPANARALAALGLRSGGDPLPVPGAPDREEFRRRLRDLPLDGPALVEAPPVDDRPRESVRTTFEGHEIARDAVPDFIGIREMERLLDAAEAERIRSVAQSEPAPEPRGRSVLATFVARLEPVQPDGVNRFDTLTLLPVVDREGGVEGISVVTVEAAVKAKKLRLSETGDQLIMATNEMDADVFIPAGTIFHGRSQDRVTTRDLIVKAGGRTPVPVLCCEERQNVRPGTFGVRTGLAGPGLRRLLLRERNQGLVWARIREQAARLGAETRTHALRAAYEKHEVQRILAVGRERLQPLLEDPAIVGFVVADGDRILGADVFGTHELFSRMSSRFLDSYLIDALSDAAIGDPGLTPQRARKFLQAVLDTRVHESPGAGLGRDAQLNGNGFFGYGLADDAGRPVHVSLFPVRGGRVKPLEPAKDPAPDTGTRPGRDVEPPENEDEDRTEAGRRAEERRDRVRRGAPSVPRTPKPPERRVPGSGGSQPGPRRDPEVPR